VGIMVGITAGTSLVSARRHRCGPGALLAVHRLDPLVPIPPDGIAVDPALCLDV
jgi:hypothetical protein